MTQPTMSKHWRKIGPKDQASIPAGPPHSAHNTMTIVQYKTRTHKIQTDKHKRIYAQWNGPSVTKPNPENCKNCSVVGCHYIPSGLHYLPSSQASPSLGQWNYTVCWQKHTGVRTVASLLYDSEQPTCIQ